MVVEISPTGTNSPDLGFRIILLTIEATMKIVNVKYMLMAQNMDRAVKFYSQSLGLEVKVHTPYWSELAHGEAIVALHGGGDGSRNTTGLSFQVDDISSACEVAVQGGAEILNGPQDRPDEGIKLADLVDPEGNEIMFSQSV